MRMLVLLMALVVTSCGYMENAYQRDMDNTRMRHVHAIADNILLYREKNNHFPFQLEARERPIEVFISDRGIPGWLKEQMPQTGLSFKTHDELEAELRTVVGEHYRLPSEPQKVETFAPNFYQYHVEPGYMCVSANLYFANKNTQSVEGRYHKYQICARSNQPNTRT